MGFSGFFKGNMVGKWTNEPCNGVDEVVDTFGVLTGVLLSVVEAWGELDLLSPLLTCSIQASVEWRLTWAWE